MEMNEEDLEEDKYQACLFSSSKAISSLSPS
jgi:hypothetical protein